MLHSWDSCSIFLEGRKQEQSKGKMESAREVISASAFLSTYAFDFFLYFPFCSLFLYFYLFNNSNVCRIQQWRTLTILHATPLPRHSISLGTFVYFVYLTIYKCLICIMCCVCKDLPPWPTSPLGSYYYLLSEVWQVTLYRIQIIIKRTLSPIYSHFPLAPLTPDTKMHFGPSRVRALPLSAGINEGGHYFR